VLTHLHLEVFGVVGQFLSLLQQFGRLLLAVLLLVLEEHHVLLALLFVLVVVLHLLDLFLRELVLLGGLEGFQVHALLTDSVGVLDAHVLCASAKSVVVVEQFALVQFDQLVLVVVLLDEFVFLHFLEFVHELVLFGRLEVHQTLLTLVEVVELAALEVLHVTSLLHDGELVVTLMLSHDGVCEGVVVIHVV